MALNIKCEERNESYFCYLTFPTNLEQRTATPYVTETDLTQCGECPMLILACDGVWDVFTDQEAADLMMEQYCAHGCAPFEDAAKVLVEAAIEKGSADNVTVIIVFL